MEKISRRNVLRTFASSWACVSALSRKSYSKSETNQKPNFIFILTDDQRHDALGCAGNSLIRTPNLDALAERGIHFENTFVTCSICSPSRATCLTGRYGSANGVMRVGGGLNEDEKTIAHYLKEAGYFTGMVGKWHLTNSPEWCGFDFYRYFRSNGRYYNRTVIEDGEEKVIEGFIEDYNARQSCDFLDQAVAKKRPFFLFHCTQIPHMNHEFDWNARPETLAMYDQDEMPVPETWQDDLEGKPPYLKESRSRTQALKYGYDKKEAIQRHCKRYYASITEMDASLGTLLEKVDQLGLRENTYIILIGDNGWFMGEHGFTSKVLPYEKSIRVPLIFCGPGIEKGVDSRLILNADLAPTILQLAGVSIPDNMHGSNLSPLFRKQNQTEWRTSFLYEALKSQLGSWPLTAVRTGRWKYVQTYDIDDPSKLAYEELYDLEKDPQEMVNRIDDETLAATKKQLFNELVRLKKRIKNSD